MKYVHKKFFAALLACALCAGGTVAWADVKIDAVNFPDENFRQWVKENAAGGGDVLTDAQIAAAEEMDLSGTGISSLKGIEHFTELTVLNCRHNALSELDLSHNPALKTLKCQNNKLTKLDVSHNPALKDLVCWGNEITKLDLSHNTALTELYCADNRITALDLSHNPALETLGCGDNKLATLDLSHNPALKEAYLPETAKVVLPNGDRIDMADFQPRRTAAGKYQLDLSRYAGKIKEVEVSVDGYCPVTASGGVYTFDPCEGNCKVRYKLGEREGEDWSLSLNVDVTEDISSVPLAEAPKGKGARPAGDRASRLGNKMAERLNDGPAARQIETVDETEREDPAAESVKGSGGIPAEITGNRVNIRQKPGLKGKVLFQLNKGDPVEATGETAADDDDGLWFQIKTPSGKTGWVFGDYIRDR